MTDLTWILDPATGQLVAAGIASEETRALAGDLLPPGHELACGRPLTWVPMSATTGSPGTVLRVARIYHGSVIDGPGRRSVVQLQGCTLHCRGCHVPDTHDPAGGVALSVPDLAAVLLDPSGEPRDGVTVLGGEPLLQPVGLVDLLDALKERGLHTTVYTGFTLEALLQRPEPSVRKALELADLLIDGPFIDSLRGQAGPWVGSANQRVIDMAATRLDSGIKPVSLPASRVR